MAGGWLGADYLSAGWVAEGWLPKQAYAPSPGSWVNQRYLARKWVSDTWLHYIVTTSGATVAVGNVPGLLLAALPGSALQTTKVNATTALLPLSPKTATANAGRRVSQVNVPGLGFGTFTGTVNAGIYQIADVTYTIEVAATFGYTKVVAQQSAPGVALGAIDAIVTTGAAVNVAADRSALALGVLPATAKANASTRAVATVPTPLQAFDCAVAVGKNIDVDAVQALPLVAIPVAVTGTSNLPTQVTATLASLSLGVRDANNATTLVDSGRIVRIRRRNNVLRVGTTKRVQRA